MRGLGGDAEQASTSTPSRSASASRRRSPHAVLLGGTSGKSRKVPRSKSPELAHSEPSKKRIFRARVAAARVEEERAPLRASCPICSCAIPDSRSKIPKIDRATGCDEDPDAGDHFSPRARLRLRGGGVEARLSAMRRPDHDDEPVVFATTCADRARPRGRVAGRRGPSPRVDFGGAPAMGALPSGSCRLAQ